MWGKLGLSRRRLARTRSATSPSEPSIDFLLWFLGNIDPNAPLQTLNIACPHMIFFSGNPDLAELILSLDWDRVDVEIRRIYDNIAAHNPLSKAKLAVNFSFRIPLTFPGGILYKNGVETRREERLQWTEKTRRKCHRAMRTKFRRLFPLIEGCPGITLNISYTLDSSRY